jgi:L-ascorbate metabolism protein UlaG (beta-lactamase superfamily)
MLHLHRLAQAGFLLRASGITLVIDAFLSPRPDRLVPPGVAPQDVVGVDAILATHEHGDHLDRASLPALVAASPAAIVIVPSPIVDQVRQIVSAERVVGATVDGTITVGAARIVAVPARHGVTMADAYTFGQELSGGLHRYLGYVVDLGGIRVYHAGDTIRYDGMAERLHALRVDLALLPINGRTAEREARGFVGNMGHTEAADLAAEADIPSVVPMHHDTIAGNTGSVAELRAYVDRHHPKLNVIEVAPFSDLVWPPD